ncbi:hypothetical protein COT79_00445 [Candidatus Berkelbacteria bacterium CG10_big_fil_rev_8_21_14_0_10_43_14]|uniref:Uncharacterized protein n=1 Tax=Candidatus Berkelbacteria bacterium CG10_big_fil_rev_8_21_14_0_10_43_14 TaxID=1974515 RepID=A0A2M6R9D8_9BACT|nr:MAG: hypothetical protein COT79_00445 [Candidatus Berkelbacteria bacterium CG10_big_fil_rev_8_21_14_0_10_43_14]
METVPEEKSNKRPTKYIVLAIIAIFALAIGFFGVTSFQNKQKTNDQKEVSRPNDWKEDTNNQKDPEEKTSTNKVTWMPTADGWQASTSDLPSCPNPVIKTPVDLTNVTSILYPGQTRGGDYKPHGGFRFNNATSSEVTVAAPMDAVVVNGSRYLVGGELQYVFDFISPCGMMYRLGHLLTLDPKYQKIADSFPQAKEGDSRTENLDPPIEVTIGETIATEVGVTKGGINAFFDFGVYNVLIKNEASQSAAWAAKPEHDPILAQHALCWFDMLPKEDAVKVKSLPGADAVAGKTSDFCK